MTAVRRSTRAKKQAESYYEDERKKVEERLSQDSSSGPPKRKRRREEEPSDPEPEETDEESVNEEDEEENEDEDEENEEEEESDGEESVEEVLEPSDESEDDEDDEDYGKKPRSPRKSSTTKKTTPKKAPLRKAPIRVGLPNTNRKNHTVTKATPKGIQNALAALAKKVLDKSETVETSLTARLLQASHGAKRGRLGNNSVYTAQLEDIARDIIKDREKDANQSDATLLNMMFRCVGGTPETFIDPELTVVEDMDAEEWQEAVTDLVNDMGYTPAEHVLLCADPDGAVHAAAVDAGKAANVTAASLGVREFRKLYEEFWFVLASVALTEGYGSTDTTTPFDTELAKDLIHRVNDLVSVAQPDIRAAATIASMKMGLGLLNRTVELEEKLEKANRQFKAAHGGRKGKLSSKAEALKHHIDSLKRVMADLEETVLGSVIQAVFMHRYRDSNMYIRAFTLTALSEMTLLRPDVFLSGKYLKYFGWMLSDKEPCVRIASLRGILAPFKVAADKPKNAAQARLKNKIDLEKMENVVGKFQGRLADCSIDVSIGVQETALSLLLLLLRGGFLDDIANDNIWNQINLRALDAETTPQVRKDALYFIMEQLEAFDDDDFEEQVMKAKKKFSKSKSASLVQSAEKMVVQRLDSLASWVAHTLTDGPIPLDKIRVELADHVVESLRAMPEHSLLVTNWSAMLRAISDDSRTSSNGRRAHARADVAKQRVLVRMLATAAQAEVGEVAAADFLDDDSGKKAKKSAKKKGANAKEHEVLSVALLNALPDLLVRFKTDPAILRSITVLPRYILPSVVSLPSKKNEFKALTKTLVDTFLDASDDTVLQNVAMSLSFLAREGHVRSKDADLQLQRLASALCDRVIQMLGEDGNKDRDDASMQKEGSKAKARRSRRSPRSSIASDATDEPDDEESKSSAEKDREYAISVGLKRLRVLAKRLNVAKLLASKKGYPVTIETVRNVVVAGVERRLRERQVVVVEKAKKGEKKDAENDGEDDDDGVDDDVEYKVPEVWEEMDASVHAAIAESIQETLDFLLATTAWSLKEALDQDPVRRGGVNEEVEGDDDEDLEEHVVAKQRDQIAAILQLCFEQYVSKRQSDDSEKYSEEHLVFADSVQLHAGQAFGDLRSLFPKGWSDAASPLLRICALTDDQDLVAGFVRYFRSKEDELRSKELDSELVKDLLLPFARSVATNWKHSNRREAGYALAHIVGSGQEASKIVGTMTRIIKKIDPIRLLEAQMASLRTAFEDWLNSEPAEVESQRPTDEEMAEFADAEKKYQERLHLMEQQAGRLSQSLGVGKLSDPKLKRPLLGFLREGFRFSFSNDTPEGEEPLMLGGRLMFLSLLSKYGNWVNRDREVRATLQRDLDDRERDLRNDPDFDDIHEDDLAALIAFRKSLGFKLLPSEDVPKTPSSSRSRQTTDDSDLDTDEDAHSVGSSASGDSFRSAQRKSRGSSVGSVRSKLSTTAASLSPLYEEDDDDSGSPVGETPQHKRRRTVATTTPIEEEDESVNLTPDETPSPPKRRKKSFGSSKVILKTSVAMDEDDADRAAGDDEGGDDTVMSE